MKSDRFIKKNKEPIQSKIVNLYNKFIEFFFKKKNTEPTFYGSYPKIKKTSTQRNSSIDAIRCIAILGILVMNIEYYFRPSATISWGINPDLDTFNHIVACVVRFFVHGKFWSIYALLFGTSMVWAAKHHTRWNWQYKRLFVLLLIGMAHAILIWSGDILTDYALAGTLVWALYQKSWKITLSTLIVYTLASFIWAPNGIGSWFIVGVSMFVSMYYIHSKPDNLSRWWKAGLSIWAFPMFVQTVIPIISNNSKLHQFYLGMKTDAVAESYAVFHHTYLSSLFYRWHEWTTNRFIGMSLMMIIGVMMIGVWAAKSQFWKNDNVVGWKKWLKFGLPIGIVLTSISMFLAPSWLENNSKVYMIASAIFQWGQLPMALGYFGLFLLFFKKYNSIADKMAPAGRMTLTMYLTQNIVGVFVFAGWGLSWSAPFWELMLVCIGFASIQCVISIWWLKKHKNGPMEWIWRKFTGN